MAIRKISLLFSMPIFLISVFCLLQIGCGGSTESTTPRPEVITGDAVIGLHIVDGGPPHWPGDPTPSPVAGYTALNMDLNGGSGGHYIWLYYKMGKANGADGTPISKIYTVDESERKTSIEGTKMPVNLNEGGVSGYDPLWLYYINASWPVARCVVVDR